MKLTKIPKRKAEFLTPLFYDDVSTFAQPVLLDVRAPFRIYSTILKNEFEIPTLFRSDGRSAPRALWGIVPPIGPALWAAVPHDFLYKNGGYYLRVGESIIFIPIDQSQADAVYRELMILKGFSRTKSWYSYAALRMFGRKAWDDHRREDV